VTEIGEVEVMMPRDRNGSFEPVTIPKHQRRLDGLTGNVISLYAKGMTTGDIQAHRVEIYGTEISRETISELTDAIVQDIVAWQNRPLDPVYAVMLIDAIVIKVRGSQVSNRPVYVAIGATQGSSVLCQAAIGWSIVLLARRCSSAIMSRQRLLASRRLRRRIASLRVLPSAILVSK
jgi:hypothetical protein